jgi:gluconolactonase
LLTNTSSGDRAMTNPDGLAVATIARDVGRCEGPLICQSGELRVVSMSHGCIYEIEDGTARTYAQTEGAPNGMLEMPNGDLYITQAGSRRGKPKPLIGGGIQRVDTDGTVSWVNQDAYSPNDLCLGPDGRIYYTDPFRRSWDGDHQDGRIWRFYPATQESQLLATVDYFANSIRFGLEADAVYVASTAPAAQVLRYPLDADRLGSAEVFTELRTGSPDGFAFDIDGNLVVCAVRLEALRTRATSPLPSGLIFVYDRDGREIDSFSPGPSSLYSNIALDLDGTAYVTDMGGGQVLQIRGRFNPGLPLYPFRPAPQVPDAI